MSIKTVRIFALILLIIILFSKQFQILYYFFVLFISLEYLNQNEKYNSIYNYRLLNAIFVSYAVFICIERGRPTQFYPFIEIIINSIEHLLFGFVICLKIAVYYSILKNKISLKGNELIRIAVTFNIIGFANEFFQNWYKHQSLWQLNIDSRKDILMNIFGTLIFILFYKKINNKIHIQTTKILK